MQTKWMRLVFILLGLFTLDSFCAFAQVGTAVRSLSRTDVAVSGYGAFGGATTGNNTAQSPSNSAGTLVELRYIKNPIVGFEGTYSFNRANQTYSYVVLPTCPTSGCNFSPAAVSANAHEVTADWVASVKLANLRPFALAGGGLLLDVPVSGQSNTSTSTKPLFVYGAGLDWGLLPHLGLRFQYRGNLYKAVDLTTRFSSTGAFMHTAEPMLGAYFQF